MVSEADDNKFTWVIKDFSSLQSRKIYSDEFLIGGCKWYENFIFIFLVLFYVHVIKICLGANSFFFFFTVRCLIAYPKGSKVDSLSLYLGVADHESLPLGWTRNAKFSLKLVNQFSDKSSILRGTTLYITKLPLKVIR